MALNKKRENFIHNPVEKDTMTTEAPLTNDEHKAAEAAFRGLPLNPKWSQSAQRIYRGILEVTNGRDVVTNMEMEPLAVGA